MIKYDYTTLRTLLDEHGHPGDASHNEGQAADIALGLSIHDHPASGRPREIHFMVKGQKVAEIGPVTADPSVHEEVVPGYVDLLSEWDGKPVGHQRTKAKIVRDNGHPEHPHGGHHHHHPNTHGWAEWDHQVTYRQLDEQTGRWVVHATDTEEIIGYVVTKKRLHAFTADGRFVSLRRNLNDSHDDIDRVWRHRLDNMVSVSTGASRPTGPASRGRLMKLTNAAWLGCPAMLDTPTMRFAIECGLLEADNRLGTPKDEQPKEKDHDE